MVVISRCKLYPALFPLKWLICIPNISAVRRNVVFETLHDFYGTAIIKEMVKASVLIILTSDGGHDFNRVFQLRSLHGCKVT